MLNTHNHFMASPLRITLALLAGLFLLAGCGSDDKKDEDKKDEKKPAYERVVILKNRFEQLENSLDEMERELLIHKKRIESTRETVKSIKRSLLKGNLKGYSLGTVTTDPLVMKAIEKRQNKEQQDKLEKAEKKDSDDTLFNGFLIACFVIFLIAVFVVALKDRNQASPYDRGVMPNYPEPNPPPKQETAEPPPADIEGAEESTDYSEYGELRPREQPPETPEGDEQPGTDGEPHP